MSLKTWYLNEQGKRKNIEDSLFPLPGKRKAGDRVFIVCDGVGGESKGEIASRIVCDTIGEQLSGNDAPGFTKEMISHACDLAVKKMKAYVSTDPDASRMNTTLTLVCLQPDGAWVAWCGDSRVYHIRDGKLLWRTRDHSIVEELVSRGEITEDEAAKHPQKNIILRSIGINSDASMVDFYFLDDLKTGDYLLLCTDGLLERNGVAQFREILSVEQTRDDKDVLFADNSRDVTHDNYSMYLLCIGDTKVSGKKSRFAFLLLGLAVLLAFFLIWRFSDSDSQTKESKPTIKKNSSQPVVRPGKMPVRSIPKKTN